MSHVATAGHDSICPICGEMIVAQQDQIRLKGMPSGRIIHKGTTTILGTCPHADCAPEEPNKAPWLTWWQIENLLNLLKGDDIDLRDEDETVERTTLRRFKSACKLARDNKTTFPMRGENDPVIALPDGFMQAYIWLLKRAGQKKQPQWRPMDIRTHQPWFPAAEAPSDPNKAARDAYNASIREKIAQRLQAAGEH